MAELVNDIRKRHKLGEKAVKSVPKAVSNTLRTVTRKANGFFIELGWLTVVVTYFIFTGLAILFNRTLPKPWLDLLPVMGGKKVAEKIVDHIPAPPKKVKEQKRTKIVDLETGETIKT